VRRESGPHGAGLYRRPGVGGGARRAAAPAEKAAWRPFGVAVPAVPPPERAAVVDQAAEDDAIEW
jgi:hypothetical protein